ncbi:MAG: peptidylprolyl isomerase [Desulfitobacteriaceae bacterium]
MQKARMGMIAGALVLVLATAGCSLAGGKWVAKVNGDSISQDEFNKRLAASETLYTAQGMDFKSDKGKQAEPQLKSSILDRMVQGKVISQEVKKLNLDSNDPKVKQEEADLKKNFGDEAKFQDALKQQGMTEQELLDFLALYQKITVDIKVSDSDVKAYFDKNTAKYGHPEQVKARHILLKTEEEAKQVIAQLKAGANFEQLAKDKSIEPGAKDSGGELGTFGRGQMVKEFEDAAFAQKVGTFSTVPVKSKFGYHVILVEAHTPEVKADLNAVKAQVQQDALTQAKDDKFQAYSTDLQTKAKIEYAQGFKPEGK